MGSAISSLIMALSVESTCQILFDSQSHKLYIFDGVLLLPSGGFSQVFDEFRSRLLGVDELGSLKFRPSLNGVYVNRVRVRKAKIQEISVGDEVLFVCGKEGLCHKHGRVGFVVQQIDFEGRDTLISEDNCRKFGASVSSGHSRGTLSSGKRSKRVFAPMEHEINSPVSGFYPPKAVGVIERLNSLVSYCRHILSSTIILKDKKRKAQITKISRSHQSPIPILPCTIQSVSRVGNIDMDARKRGRPEAAALHNSNGGFKRSKQEMESHSTGLGSKSKPCTKFFSTSGCPFGDNCHFLHYVPGGFNAAAQMTNLRPPVAQVSRNMQGSGGAGGRFSGRGDPGLGPVSTFGASATSKISVDASLAGAIIGKGGIHSKQICRQTGVKLSIIDHESDPNLKIIELEGTFEQINVASGMVRELLGRLGSANKPQGIGGSEGKPHPGSNFKSQDKAM